MAALPVLLGWGAAGLRQCAADLDLVAEACYRIADARMTAGKPEGRIVTSMMALTRESLDALVCAHQQEGGGDESLMLTPRCHPTSPTLTCYEDGVLTITCAYCLGLVTQIAVASQPDYVH